MAALTARATDTRRRGMPLSLVIARYFAYLFICMLAVWFAAFFCLSAAINAGAVLSASYGPANAREVVGRLAGADTVSEAEIPSAYYFALVDRAGKVLATDMDASRLERTRRAASDIAPGEVTGADGVTYAAAELSDGSMCVLASEYLPQYASRALRDALPNPQSLMVAAGVIGSGVTVALVARRARQVLVRKMAPLTDAAARIAAEQLDFSVMPTNVREVNDVLCAIETMRASLAASLEARWRAEREQREQVASLAHDLKTPLTVIRANADYVAEELAGDDAAGAAADRTELAAAARDIAAGAERLDGYVALLIEASRGGREHTAEPTAPRELCEQIVREARGIARAHGVAFEETVDPALASLPPVPLDRVALTRAAANLVANAAEHARARIRLACTVQDGMLAITVEDDGAGFTPRALEHGCERLFTENAARSGHDGARHYGLGLSTAAQAARAHGGSVELANRTEDGHVAGAVVRLAVPLGR